MEPKEVKITASIFFGKPKKSSPTEFDLPNAIFEGKLTKIAEHFNTISDRDVEYLLSRKDDHGRTSLDLACFLGFRNIVVYLLSWNGSPSVIDNFGRNAFYSLCYRGEYESCRGILQFVHFSLKQRFQHQVHSKKRELKFKNMDIKQGHLVSTVFHDEETVKRHTHFNMAIEEAFSSYCSSIIAFYREALDVADKHGRNALHFGSMSKWTKCFKTIQSLIEISYNEPVDRDFVRLMAEIEQL